MASRRTDPRTAIIAAGRRLIEAKGSSMTTQDLVREADVALQTFYRYFPSKDHLLLAVLADMISEHTEELAKQAADLPGPVERLELYVKATLRTLQDSVDHPAQRFVPSEHWRLHERYPEEVWAATESFTELLRVELEAAQDAGVLSPRDPARDAWLVNKVVVGAYHHLSFQPHHPARATIAEDVWQFCLAAVGGATRRRRRRASRRTS